MKAYISHETALAYWRRHFPLDSEVGDGVHGVGAEEYAYRKDDVIGCVPEWLVDEGRPVDILVTDAAHRRHSDRVNCTVWGAHIPPGAFYQVGRAYISSPEFLFLQMASRLTVAQLAALGCELCGLYVLLPKGVTRLDTRDYCPTRIAALTDVGKIGRFIDQAGATVGVRKARRALRFVVDGSRSPMETQTMLQLCLSPMLGGYGLPLPEMNAAIQLDEESRVIANRRSAQGDLCWCGEKLDLEYHGDVHVGSAKMKDDVGRTLGIEHMGWRVITVTGPQVLDIAKFEVVAKDVAKHLKRRLKRETLDALQARRTLHDELEAWAQR